MLTGLRVKNFKPWRDSGRLRLAPLTVFFGRNSSGKSSLHQLLLMLKQTAQSPDRQRVLHPGDDRLPLDLGAWRDFVHGHEEDRTLEFELEWKPLKPLVVEDKVSGARIQGDRIRFGAAISSVISGRVRPQVESFSYELSGEGFPPLRVGMSWQSARGEYRLDSSGYTLEKGQGRPHRLGSVVKFYGFPDEVAADYKNAEFTGDLVLHLENLLASLQYLGPLRNRPRRFYTWSGEQPESVGWEGEGAPAALLAAQDRRLNWSPRGRYRPFHAVAAHWLKELGLIDDFEVNPLAPDRKQFEVVVRQAPGGPLVNLVDVGFGVSQVFPVVIQSFYARKGSTVIFEQPEIHLHPSVESNLADLFIAAIQAREDNADRGVQLIVESHSEHLLRRLQRRIAEGHLKPEQAALYVVRTRAGEAVAEPLEVNRLGEICNWPDNFFGDDTEDLIAMTEAAVRREQEEARSCQQVAEENG